MITVYFLCMCLFKSIRCAVAFAAHTTIGVAVCITSTFSAQVCVVFFSAICTRTNYSLRPNM